MEILPEQVRPGDLITADFMNRLLNRLDALEGRVEALEGEDDGSDGDVVITQLIPSGTPSNPIQAGQQLQILGHNFGFSVGGHRVFFNSTLVTTFGVGSSDSRLVVTVPTGLGLPQGGGPVALTVSNGVTTDSRTVTVRPVQTTISGDVDVLWRDGLTPNPDPNPIPAPDGGPEVVLFGYRLRSRASLPAAFTVTPTISVAAWQGNLEVLNADQQVLSNRRIQLAPDQEANFFIRATLTPTDVPQNAFTLNVVASSGGVTGGLERAFELGEEVEEGDDQIVLAFSNATPINLATGTPDDGGGSFNPSTNTITVAPGFRVDITFDATFLTATRYDVSVEANGAAANWDLQVRTPNTGFYDAANQTPPINEAPRFSVQPEDGASAQGQMTFRIQRQGEARSQTRLFNLALLSPQ